MSTTDSASISRIEGAIAALTDGFGSFRADLATIKNEQANQQKQIAAIEQDVTTSIRQIMVRMEERDKPRTGWYISLFTAAFLVMSALIAMNVFFVNSTINGVSSPLESRITGIERMTSDHHDLEERTARSQAADARSEQDRAELNRRMNMLEDRVSDAIATWRGESSKLEAGFTENETQFKNLTALVHLLFKKVYGDDFPVIPRETPMSFRPTKKEPASYASSGQ